MMRLRPLLFALWMGGMWLAIAGASETLGSPAPPIRHASVLKFIDGSYTSIFGLVPKKYKFESEESREIVQKFVNDGEYTLDLVGSNTRRILSLPEETPTVESAPKPLTGRSIRALKKGENWDYEVVGHESPSQEEKREAQRLVSRFRPDASPFRNLAWDADGTAQLNLSDILKFLGYMEPENLQGSAVLKRMPDDPNTDGALQLEAIFDSGVETNRISVELKGTGAVALTDQTPYYRKVRIDGELIIHGQRELPDGRKVPYSLVSPFSYETSAVPVPAT